MLNMHSVWEIQWPLRAIGRYASGREIYLAISNSCTVGRDEVDYSVGGIVLLAPVLWGIEGRGSLAYITNVRRRYSG